MHPQTVWADKHLPTPSTFKVPNPPFLFSSEQHQSSLLTLLVSNFAASLVPTFLPRQGKCYGTDIQMMTMPWIWCLNTIIPPPRSFVEGGSLRETLAYNCICSRLKFPNGTVFWPFELSYKLFFPFIPISACCPVLYCPASCSLWCKSNNINDSELFLWGYTHTKLSLLIDFLSASSSWQHRTRGRTQEQLLIFYREENDLLAV